MTARTVSTPLTIPDTDPLLEEDPARVADAAATECLLRCWVREQGVSPVRSPEGGGTLELDLPTTGVRLRVPVVYWSPTGRHRFGTPWLGDAPADAATVAVLLAREAAADRRVPAAEAVADLTERVLDSARRVSAHVARRRAAPAEQAGTTPFLSAEQALLLGHPLHPTPKSRDGITDREAAAYSPELRGSFPLHWFAADRFVVRSDSELGRSAEDVLAELAGDGLTLPPGTVPVPAHPWQARSVLDRPGVRSLLDSGLLHDLGPAGPAWSPTSSLRTVYRADAPVMLKLSLGLRITNSRREHLSKELRRGVEVHRLFAAGLGDELARRHACFDIVRDPAWLAVTTPPQRAESGLEVVLRDNPFSPAEDVACVAGLVAERPDRPASGGESRLAELVRRLAAGTGRPLDDICDEWFARYLRVVALPVLWLYTTHGVALEAHQQNTLVVLDGDGWPVGGRYRDNQGYYFAASRADQLSEWLPYAGEEGETICADEVIDTRLGYYLAINNLFGLVGAFGAQGLADERDLLAQLRRFLERFARGREPAPRLLAALLDAPTLRCKANLLTRVDGLDELVGPLETQSVYVDIANPLGEVR